MSALREDGRELAEHSDLNPRVVPAVGRDLLASVLDRDAGRALWIVGVGSDLDDAPEATGLGASGVERAAKVCRIAGLNDMRLGRIAGEDRLAHRHDRIGIGSGFVQEPHDVFRVQARESIADLLRIGVLRPTARLESPSLRMIVGEDFCLRHRKEGAQNSGSRRGVPAGKFGPKVRAEVRCVDRCRADHRVRAGQQEIPAEPGEEGRLAGSGASLHGYPGRVRKASSASRCHGSGLTPNRSSTIACGFRFHAMRVSSDIEVEAHSSSADGAAGKLCRSSRSIAMRIIRSNERSDLPLDRLGRPTPCPIQYGRRRPYARRWRRFRVVHDCLERRARSGVISRAAAFTSAMVLRASIVAGRFGRPPGLPEMPGLKLVDRRPPFDIAWFCLFHCLFG